MRVVQMVAVLGILIVLASTGVRADTVYSNLAHNSEKCGYLGPDDSYADEVQLDAPSATLTSMTLQTESVTGSYDEGSLTLSFLNVNPGNDGNYLTQDDVIGAPIQTGISTDSFTMDPNSTYVIDGFSVDVGRNFVWRIENNYSSGENGFDYMLKSSGTGEGTGGSANPKIIWKSDYDGNEPETGKSPRYYSDGNWNPSIKFEGVATPEPGTTALALLAAAAGVFAVWRKRLKGED